MVLKSGPRDIPCLPLSVSEIATRYEPPSNRPPTSRRTSGSPSTERQPLRLNTTEQSLYQESVTSGYVPGPLSSSPVSGEDEPARRRQDRIEELDESGVMDKEGELRQRERELEQKTRELERDRANLMTVRGGNRGDGYTSDSSRGPHSSPHSHSPSQRVDFPSSPTPQPRHSYSTTYLAPPPTSSVSQPRSSVSSTQSSSGHAEFCGCNSCSIANYRTQKEPSPYDLRPPEPPINIRPDKPKGWIRRLSMPVGLILDSNSKKTHHTNASSGNLQTSLASPAEDGRLDGKFAASGFSNRSMTNLRR
jgi:hypothetical protein